MNEIALSNDLSQIELEINHHKQIAGQSIWEIGRRLNHVKENDLAHGQFMEWVENKIGIHNREANRMMKVANELPNSTNWSNLSSRVIYLISTLPEEEKEKQIERVENGETPKIKEIEDLKRKLKESEERNKRLAEQALKQEVVEKEVVIEKVPDDYKATQDLNKQLLGKNKDLADELDSVKRSLRLKEASYEMLEKETSEALALKESIEHLRADKEKLENSVTNIFNLSKLVTKFEDFFDEEMAPLRFKTLIQGIGKDAQIEKLRDILTLTENWLDEMNKIIPENGRTIIEGEIINE